MMHVIATPIGNLEDISIRAVNALKSSSLIACEDTRRTWQLLTHLGIPRPEMISYRQGNEEKVTNYILSALDAGREVSLCSDGGYPGISDPGFLLVRTCVENGVEVETLPGDTAFVPALVNSGFPCDRFCFEGFLPQKKGRKKRLAALASEPRTMIFYESPFRVLKALGEFAEVFGSERKVSVSRELSKKFEQTVRGTIGEVISHFEAHPPKGEFVMIVEGASSRESSHTEDEE
mgnify:CR=1 FL=1